MDPDVILRQYSDDTYVTSLNDSDTLTVERSGVFSSILEMDAKKSFHDDVQSTKYVLAPDDASTVAGKVFWHAASGTLAVGRADGLSVIKLNEGVQTVVKAAESLVKGAPLYVVSESGGYTMVGNATAGNAAKRKVVGFATVSAASGSVLHMMAIGVIDGVHSSLVAPGELWSAGDVLWLSSIGTYTNVKPLFLNGRNAIGAVLKAGVSPTCLVNSSVVPYALEEDVTAANTRIDNLIIESGTSDAEVIDARLSGNTGVLYTLLKNRLDAMEKQMVVTNESDVPIATIKFRMSGSQPQLVTEAL